VQALAPPGVPASAQGHRRQAARGRHLQAPQAGRRRLQRGQDGIRATYAGSAIWQLGENAHGA